MALIKCPECGKEISEFAPRCSNCGFPMDMVGKITTGSINPQEDTDKVKNNNEADIGKYRKSKRSDASRKADRKYNEVHKPIGFSISYKTDKEEGERLKAFLEETNDNANHYIKALIKKDLDFRNYHIE